MTAATDQFIDPTVNPSGSNAAIAAVLAEGSAPEAAPIPSIPAQPAGFVRLSAGLRAEDGRILTDVEVRELNGEHEERISKVRQGDDLFRFLDTLLQCGVVNIGGQPVTPEILQRLLVGDRDHLVLAISQATYGEEIQVGRTRCLRCNEEHDVTVKGSDIPVKPFNGGWEFDIPLRKGGKAHVRLPNGADQEAYMAGEHTDAERNSILLSRCVLTITDADGDEEATAGFPSMVRENLGVLDRRAILSAINERQPGPQYDEVEHTHDCGEILPVGVGLMHLFPGM